MGWSADQVKAIFGYAKKRELRVVMSSSVGSDPKVYFLDKNEVEVSVPISDVVLEYRKNTKEEARERKRIKTEEERNKSWQERFNRD